MHIAQVAPLYESVPPRLYGGTERIVSYLTEELISMGHEVTLFASGDSSTKARLIPCCEQSLRLLNYRGDPIAKHLLMLERIYEMVSDFDVIHFHVDYLHYPVSRRLGIPSMTTLHGRLDQEDTICLYDEFDDIPLISISNSQRFPIPTANWLGTVYHGLPHNLYRLRESTEGYLAFIGRIAPEKRLDRAIEIAKMSGHRLKIAAKVDPQDASYFARQIKHLLDDPSIEYIGEIDEGQKNDFLGNAKGLLFPIDWPEPFGLVMIEAMACGTPVIAYNAGSVPEVIEHEKTGFIVDSISSAVEAVKKLGDLSRIEIRKAFEDKFSARSMAENYLRLYKMACRRFHPERPKNGSRFERWESA